MKNTIRDGIVNKINSIHDNPHLLFNEDEIEYMVSRYLSSHSKSKVKSIRLGHILDVRKGLIKLEATLKSNSNE